MTTAPRTPVAPALHGALGVVLAALVCLWGLTAVEPSAPDAGAVAVVTAEPASGAAALPATPGTASPGQGAHHDDPVGLLCLCAVLVVSAMLTMRSPDHQLIKRVPADHGRRIRLLHASYAPSTTPLAWGVSRT